MAYNVIYKKSVHRDLRQLGKEEARHILDRIENELTKRLESNPPSQRAISQTAGKNPALRCSSTCVPSKSCSSNGLSSITSRWTVLPWYNEPDLEARDHNNEQQKQNK